MRNVDNGPLVQNYEIRPGQGIGPVSLGQTREAAKSAMEGVGGSVRESKRWEDAPPVLAMCENAFQVYFDGSDVVEEIELMGPAGDGQLLAEEPSFVASYGDLDVFRTPATELAALVARDAEPDVNAADHGPALTFPTLGLVLWRDGSPDDPPSEWSRFFMTVLVRAPST